MKTRLNGLTRKQLLDMLYDNPLHIVYSCEDFSKVRVCLCFDNHPLGTSMGNSIWGKLSTSKNTIDIYQETIDLNDREEDVDFTGHTSELDSCSHEALINWVLENARGDFYDIHLFTDKEESVAIKEAIEEFKELCGSVLEDGYVPTNLPL
jgi:hypothetical protein